MTEAVTDLPLVKLRDFSLACEHPLGENFWRIDDRVVAANNHLVIRRKETSVALLEELPEFPEVSLAAVRGWRASLKLFVVDAFTLRAWAGDEMPEMVPCDECGGSGEVEDRNDEYGEGVFPVVSCFDCDGDGLMPSQNEMVRLTPTRIVDRRYLALVARMASEGEVVGVFAASKKADSLLHFVGHGWDAYLMPCRPIEGRDLGEPLWKPARVLEGGAHP